MWDGRTGRADCLRAAADLLAQTAKFPNPLPITLGRAGLMARAVRRLYKRMVGGATQFAANRDQLAAGAPVSNTWVPTCPWWTGWAGPLGEHQ